MTCLAQQDLLCLAACIASLSKVGGTVQRSLWHYVTPAFSLLEATNRHGKCRSFQQGTLTEFASEATSMARDIFLTLYFSGSYNLQLAAFKVFFALKITGYLASSPRPLPQSLSIPTSLSVYMVRQSRTFFLSCKFGFLPPVSNCPFTGLQNKGLTEDSDGGPAV